MNCPNCSTELILERRNKTDMAVCRGCSGILLSEVSGLKLVPALEKYASDPDSAKDKGAFPDSARMCPVCNKNYKLLNYEKVELDFCPGCKGIWFDRNELESILSYMKKNSPGDQDQAGITTGGVGLAISDVGVEIVLGFLGEAVSGIFDAIFD